MPIIKKLLVVALGALRKAEQVKDFGGDDHVTPSQMGGGQVAGLDFHPWRTARGYVVGDIGPVARSEPVGCSL